MLVIKRDCSLSVFDKSKITKAILNSMKKGSGIVDEYVASEIAEEIYQMYSDKEEISIYDIEENVIRLLHEKGHGLTAKLYKRYRDIREVQRNIVNTTDTSIGELISGVKNEVSYDNSNKNATLNATQRDLIAGETSKDFAKRLMLPSHLVQAIETGILYYHDLDYTMQTGMFNCCLVNIGDMLDNGTVINGVMIESPKSFQVACNIITQIMAQIASNQYGGQSVNIKHLGKYLRRTYDKAYNHYRKLGYDVEVAEDLAEDIMKSELKDGVQKIQYQINTLMTSNGQSPFVTIFLHIEKGHEYEQEIAMIVEEILAQRLMGVKNEQGVYITPAFPKLVYVLNEDNCLKGGKYDYITKLACKCTAKRMYPDYISEKEMKKNYEGNVFSPMGCRSFLSTWKDENGEYKFEGRFNQGVVSINLPQLGIVSKGDEEKFWRIFDERLELCKEALLLRHELLEGTVSDVSPVHWQYGAIARLEKGETIDKLLHGGYSTISLGYIGLYELTYLMKGVSHTTKVGEEFALRVMKYMREKCDEWKAQYDIGFGLYGTPAESLCYKFAKIDNELFGSIENVTDKGYYTNSYHVDVRENIGAFEKFTFEKQFQEISSGGCISYCEIPNLTNNTSVIEEIVKFIYDNIQYAEFNTKSDYCHCCGFEGEINLVNDVNGELVWECPNCGNRDENKLTVTRRTCGYLGSHFWCKGKTKEINSRVLHLDNVTVE